MKYTLPANFSRILRSPVSAAWSDPPPTTLNKIPSLHLTYARGSTAILLLCLTLLDKCQPDDTDVVLGADVTTAVYPVIPTKAGLTLVTTDYSKARHLVSFQKLYFHQQLLRWVLENNIRRVQLGAALMGWGGRVGF